MDIRLELLGVEREVVSCRLREGASERTAARVIISAALDEDLDAAVTQSAALCLAPRRWTLVVAAVEFCGIEGGSLRYALELRDPLWLLELCTNTRKFRNLTTEQIVDRVLAEAGIACRWETERATAVRNWCVQYRETSLAFVERLLAFEGIHYRFDDDGTAIFADDSRAAPAVDGSFTMLDPVGALTADRPGILELARGARVASGSITLNDKNWKTPSVSLMQNASAEQDTDLELYDFPAGYREPNEGALLSRMRLEAERAETRYLAGASNAAAFAPGHAFEMSGLFEGRYWLARVEHHAEHVSEETVYRNRFDAIPADVVFRPVVPQRPVIAGHHTAMVRGPAGEEIHTDTHGRFKAQFHWDREATGSDEDSRWLRILQESGSGMALARVGWEMNVGYIDGDPDRPVGLARNINGAMTPTYPLPKSKTMMTMKSPSSPATGGFNELSLDDLAGAQRFAVRAERDFVGIVKNDRSESIGQNELRVVGASLSRAITQCQTTSVAGDRTSAINKNGTLDIAGNRSKTVGSQESVSIAQSAAVITGSSQSEQIGSVRLTIAGGLGPPRAAQLAPQALPAPQSSGAKTTMAAIACGGGGAVGLPAPPSLSAGSLMSGLISRMASASITRIVGGALVSASLGNIATKVKAAFVETVGGVKVTVAKDGISQKVGGILATTVGGAMLRTAMKDIALSAKLQRVTVGGMATIGAGESLSIKAKTVTIQTRAELLLRSGDVSIAMAPESITIEGDIDLDAGSQIEVQGAKKENLTSA